MIDGSRQGKLGNMIEALREVRDLLELLASGLDLMQRNQNDLEAAVDAA